MIRYQEIFPAEDGSAASWQERQDMKESERLERQSRVQAEEYLKMITSIMK